MFLKKTAKYTPCISSSYLSNARDLLSLFISRPAAPACSTASLSLTHVCTYLRPFSHYTSQQRRNNVFVERVPLLTLSFEGNPRTQEHEILSRKKLEFLGSPQWKFRDSSLHRFDTIPQCDEQTDGQIACTWTMAKTREAFCYRA